MKTPILLIMAASLVCSVAAANDELPHVKVYGTAVTEVQPDLLRWRIMVGGEAAEVAAVAEAHAKDVEAALEFLRQEGIPAKDIQTSQMQFSEHREYRSKSWVKEGYDASTVVSFTTKKLEQYRTLWLGLSRLRGVSVDSVAWDYSRRIEAQNATRADALKAAKEKAATMAKALGVEIAEPLAIEEMPMTTYDSRMGNFARNAVVEAPGSDDEGGAVSPGSIEVRIRVQVTFRIVGK